MGLWVESDRRVEMRLRVRSEFGLKTENEVGKGDRIEIRDRGDRNGDEHKKEVWMEMGLRMVPGFLTQAIDVGWSWL